VAYRRTIIGGRFASGQLVKIHLDTQPYWISSATLPLYPKLDRDEQVDVLIVGAGITGLTAAYLLTAAGKSVAVIERERGAQIDTGHTSAHLTMVTDRRLTDLASSFGRNHAQAVWDAGLAAIVQIDAIVRDERIDCDFAWVPGYLHAGIGTNGSQTKSFEEEASLAESLGFDAAFTHDVPFVGGPGVIFDDQARFHPRKYLADVARTITDRGGLIFEHTAADEFCDAPLSVKANGHTITCGQVVIATHNPLVGNTGMLSATLFQTKLALYTSYVMSGRVEKGRIPDALFWDVADAYHYLRLEPHRDHDVVIFGGEDHKTGQASDTNACFDRLERTLRSMIGDLDVTHRWSGQVIETPDGLPYIGETAPRQFTGTGFSGNGMTFGTLTGMMAADHLLGQKNPWSELFEPDRKKVRGGLWDYLRENKDYPYYLARDRVAGAEGRSVRTMRRGTGRVLNLNGQHVAVYRDDSGATTRRSAVCTHMGCLVDWNEAERTWDCPCHGSRFKPNGAVISGPAESPLPEPEK
jgi:glycine/D-amino acid oxidase-like deaminating enzyme/nitrite reductase/ring-hydroxylating ferredoxin subunit